MCHNGKPIKIVFLPLPEKVYGLTAESKDDYLIGINQNSAAITQRHTIGHELAHIFLNHFTVTGSCVLTSDSIATVDMKLSNSASRYIEKEANRQAWNYYRMYKSGILDSYGS